MDVKKSLIKFVVLMGKAGRRMVMTYCVAGRNTMKKVSPFIGEDIWHEGILLSIAIFVGFLLLLVGFIFSQILGGS